MKWLGRKVCQLVSIKVIALLASRMLIGAHPPEPFSAAGWSQQSAARLSCTHQPAGLQNVLTLTKWHIQGACGQVWKHCLKSYCRFSDLPHSGNLSSVKSEARRPLNKLINYIITNCDACRLVTGALSENGNNLLFKVGEGSDMQDERWRWRRFRKATCVWRVFRQRKVCQFRVSRLCSLWVKATGEVVPRFRTHDPTFMVSEYLGNLIIFYFHIPPISNITEWGVNYWISFKHYPCNYLYN